jgi:exodeoxyribonuclease-3
VVAHAGELYAIGTPVVLAGDYNVVPTDLDIYLTKSWDRDALLQPESRAGYQRLLSQGWTDAIRALHPKEPMYTFWDYMRNRWERDGGLRLDHILLSSALMARLQFAGVDRHVRGLEGRQRSCASMGKTSLCAKSLRRVASTYHSPGDRRGSNNFGENGPTDPSDRR